MRSVPEWIGKTDDTRVPIRVQIRVYDRNDGKCHWCKRKIDRYGWVIEHVKALINGGENRETNLALTCFWCVPEKNAEDLKEKARIYRIRKAHLGIKKPSRFPYSRSSPWKKKISGEIVKR